MFRLVRRNKKAPSQITLRRSCNIHTPRYHSICRLPDLSSHLPFRFNARHVNACHAFRLTNNKCSADCSSVIFKDRSTLSHTDRQLSEELRRFTFLTQHISGSLFNCECILLPGVQNVNMPKSSLCKCNTLKRNGLNRTDNLHKKFLVILQTVTPIAFDYLSPTVNLHQHTAFAMSK